MAPLAPHVLKSYLLRGFISSRGCLHGSDVGVFSRRAVQSGRVQRMSTLPGHTASSSPTQDAAIPFRQQLKEEAKRKKHTSASTTIVVPKSGIERNDKWELTVGIEIHAQLNTSKKLFSVASSTINEEPNTEVALFDLAMPGSQPLFQKEALVPAIRAALALNCNIQQESRFDRKHYFHWDQPAGYQITQYYHPFAKDGHIMLYPHDGIAEEDGSELRIGIKQVQMEQDTAKTIAQPGGLHLLDFNRAGIPLIEIITLPEIHYPSTAAALVRKLQALLSAVDACVLGMELGGFRADVNVSVRRREMNDANAHHGYAGIAGLGQRTEIKNLSSFKAVRDAIVAERDRQIEVLEAGGTIAGETRGWSLGSTETRRLRGKEGEVDYRYMPDPDVAPVIISDDLVSHLKEYMGVPPDDEIEFLVNSCGLRRKNAISLMGLDNGGRMEYFYRVIAELSQLREDENDPKRIMRACCNWVLHELGGLAKDSSDDFNPLQIDMEGNCIIPADQMAQIIHHLESKLITSGTAKNLLRKTFDSACNGVTTTVTDLIEEGNLLRRPMTEEEYRELAAGFMTSNLVNKILKGQDGKIMYIVGQMMRQGEEGRVEPEEAANVISKMIEERRTEASQGPKV